MYSSPSSPLPPSLPPSLFACSYAEPLRICVVVYLQKAPEMLNDVLRYLMKRWPKCGRSEEVFYLPLHFKRILLTILTCPPHILTF